MAYVGFEVKLPVCLFVCLFVCLGGIQRGVFLKECLRLQKSLHLGAKMNRAPPLCRRELAPTREVGAYTSFKKLASDRQMILNPGRGYPFF
jgi:hypothetical protein